LWYPGLAKREGVEKIDRYDSMDALGKVSGLVLRDNIVIPAYLMQA